MGSADELIKILPDGVPCDHPGCLQHLSHPCKCGLVGGLDVIATNPLIMEFHHETGVNILTHVNKDNYIGWLERKLSDSRREVWEAKNVLISAKANIVEREEVCHHHF